MIHDAPAAHQQAGTRWKLKTLLAAGRGLRLRTEGGLCQLLRRLKVSRKCARQHVHSPDLHYRDKLLAIRVGLQAVELAEASQVFVFADEFSLYRHPSLAAAYEVIGKQQPLAELGWSWNKIWRFAAGLNGLTGQVTYEQGSQISLAKLVRFYQRLVNTYPQAQLIWLTEDNWPVHFHPDVLAALQPQQFPYGFPQPGNWPLQPRQKVKRLNLPIRLLCLPTYASWTNPVEKLWRFLKQEVLHLHRFADDWEGLKQSVIQFLDQFATPSHDLLRYVGLSQPDQLYQAMFLSNSSV